MSELTASRITVRTFWGPSGEWYSSTAVLSRKDAHTRAKTEPIMDSIMPSREPKARHTTTRVTESTRAMDSHSAPPKNAASGMATAASTAGTLGICTPL